MPADIRPARVADVDALLSIENDVFDTDRLSRRAIKSHIDSPSAAFLVAERTGEIAGYALVFVRSGSPSARLYSIAVKPVFASAGIGRNLLCAAEDAAGKRKCARLRLEVREDNARAIALYERAGYRRIGRKAPYYEDGAAALRLEKLLEGQ